MLAWDFFYKKFKQLRKILKNEANNTNNIDLCLYNYEYSFLLCWITEIVIKYMKLDLCGFMISDHKRHAVEFESYIDTVLTLKYDLFADKKHVDSIYIMYYDITNVMWYIWGFFLSWTTP